MIANPFSKQELTNTAYRIGIAGITIYGPTIFGIAGISTKDRQWVSGLNDITYMVSPKLLLSSVLEDPSDRCRFQRCFASSPLIALAVAGLFTGAP